MIKWSGKPYTLQDDVELTQYTPAIHIKAGEHVIDGEFMNKVPGAQLWYTPMEGEARKTVVRVKQVVAADLKLAPISDEDKLPSGMPKKNKKVTTEKKALHVGPYDHEIILDEIARREESEHEERPRRIVRRASDESWPRYDSRASSAPAALRQALVAR